MSKSRKTFFGNRKKENYYKEAKKDNIRARSYFKLEQIDKKFNIIRDNTNILDLGCAPGGWLQYVDKKISKGNIVGIDLLEIKKQHEFSDKVEIIQGNFEKLEDYTDLDFDIVISDMAPEFSGNSTMDRGRTHQINLNTIKLSKKYLKKGGDLIFKTFEGEDLQNVLENARKVFEKVIEFKPNSSQKKSSELFIVCTKKLVD